MYSVKEASEKLGLDTSHIRRLLAKGEIKGKKLSRVEKGQYELIQEFGRFLIGESRSSDLPMVLDGIKATICSLKVLDALQTGEVQKYDFPLD